MHRDYVCRDAGACCTAGWPIPVEHAIHAKLRLHFGSDPALFDVTQPRPDGAAATLGLQATGACVFFDGEAERHCRVHRDVGVECLPSACRQFPRVVLNDGRGVHISLSHFCPTAAELLFGTTPLEIVPAPAPLALDGAVEGLDARGALPPLLRPGLLTDLDAYDRWERRAIALLADDNLTAADALERMAAATLRLQSWRPGGAPLAQAVDDEFDVARGREAKEDRVAREDLDADLARVAAAIASVPAGVERPRDGLDRFREAWPETARWWPSADRVTRRYLAARLFGNWVSYQGMGLHGIVEYLRVCLAVLKTEAVRAAGSAGSASSAMPSWQIVKKAVRNTDLLLVHLSDPTALSRRLS
jgi:Fe-S-cluster containining protein